ncbi:sulfatase-like hydrolase/transferase [Planctomycetota bacterium]
MYDIQKMGLAVFLSSRIPCSCFAFDNGVAQLPPMGWNSWNAFGKERDEQLFIETTDAMICSGLADVGYIYVNIDAGVRAGAAIMQEALGYRFEISEVVYPKRIDTDTRFTVSFKVKNTGSSPFYYNWPIEVSLLDPNTKQVVWKKQNTNMDIRNWMPGDQWNDATGAYAIPAETYTVHQTLLLSGVSSGEYILALAILDPAGNRPCARFAIKNYYHGGRHPIGRVGINHTIDSFSFTGYDDLQNGKSLDYDKAKPRDVNTVRVEQRPNILFCIMDDASWPHMSAYGCSWVNTPAFDRLAQEGILFRNAYTPNAKCAPSRSSILTGRNSWQLEEAANHVITFPAKFKTFPEVLRKNGYVTGKTGKGWGPGNPGTVNGQKRELIGAAGSNQKSKPPAQGISSEDYGANFGDFLEAAGEQSWFFWYGVREPHRRYEYGSGVKAGKKITEIDSVPDFWPDSEIVRNDMLDYAFEIEHADERLDRMLQVLEKKGLLENAIILMTSDNGMPFPRCKAQEYEYSNHMPLAVMWPKGIKNPGRTVDDLVSFIDFCPTFLEAAGIPYETSGMHASPGRSLTDIFYSAKEGQVTPERDIVLIGKERHDYSRPKNQGFPIRGIVSDDYMYLCNYDISLWPAGNPEIGYLDIDGSPTKTEILNLFRSGKVNSYWQLSMGKRKVNEEFFNITRDPDCMNNLAANPEIKDIKDKMKTRMQNMLKEQEDLRMFGNGDVFNSYNYSNPNGWNYYERFMQGEFTIKSTPWVNPTDCAKEPLD